MFSLTQRDRIRSALDSRAVGSPVRHAGKLRRVSSNSRLFDNFLDRKRNEFDRLNPNKKGAIGDGAFLTWLTDFITNGGLATLIAFVTKIIGLFATK